MDIVDKLDALRKERGWTINKLASEAMLTQSTVANLFAKGYSPKLSTLAALCGAFDMTVSDFFYDSQNKNLLTPYENSLLTQIQKLNETQKTLLLDFLKSLPTIPPD